ncbi:odorant receptor 85c-like [Musca autumnalis]|uniref:odorant receptor 85c-like n=1 Tax=Musca autumnalis TaxID=221902 RepID=UPI003CEF7876
MPKTELFKKFFSYVNFINATIGFESYGRYNKKTKYTKYLTKIIFYFNICNMFVIMLCEILNLFLSSSTFVNIPDFFMSMAYVGFITNSSWKVYMIWKNRSIIEECIAGLYRIYPENLELQMEYKVDVYLRQCQRFSKFMVFLFTFGIWFFNLLAFSQYLISWKILHASDPQQELPYFIYTPWNWRGHWSYYLLYALESMAGHTSAMGNVSNDLLLVALISQIVMHFDYVANTMAGYQGMEFTARRVGKTTPKRVLEFVKYFIEYHCYLLSLSDQLNDIFGILLFVHFVSTSLVICLLGFLVTIGTSALNIFKLCVFLFTLLIQSAFICYHGQLLMDASIKVSRGIFTNDWLKAEIKCQKMLILMTKRAQKPVQLKATTFIWISQGTMTVLLQMSYKFFTLLRTMYVKN